MVRLLVIASVVAVVLAGCVGPFGSEATPSPSRPANGTVVYGPSSPGCPGYDSAVHYGMPVRDHYRIESTPGAFTPASVERLLEQNLEWASDVSVSTEKYERIQFRGETFDVVAEYGTERYFHGEARSSGGDLLIVVDERRTHVYTFRVGDC